MWTGARRAGAGSVSDGLAISWSLWRKPESTGNATTGVAGVRVPARV